MLLEVVYMINNKNIINYIEKYSSPPPTGPSGKKPVPAAGVQAAPGAGKGVSAPIKLNAIGKMQDQMINLARSISSQTKDFNDFMVEGYSNESYIKGEEWDPSQRYHTKGTRGAAPLIRLDSVVDQVKKIGSSQNPIKADTIWDERTQNALRNIWAFADALVRVYEDFGSTFANPSFTKSDLQTLGGLIPKTPIDSPEDVSELKADEKNQKAKEITPLLEKLTEFYRTFSKKILDNPIYRPFIKPAVTPGLDPASAPETSKIYTKFDVNVAPSTHTYSMPSTQDIAGKSMKLELTDASGEKFFFNVPLLVLKDQRSLQKFLYDKLDYKENQVNSREVQLKVLNEISAQLGS